jgi:UTP--glucose-1-phosphate uridylyltransferase
MKAVIPAAGLGTRFLPVTKAQPKEMLPILDKPTIQYVVEEAVASGIDDLLIITGKGKRAIEDHFDKLSNHTQINKNSLKDLETLLDMVNIHYIRQKEQKGLSDAIYCARKYVGKEPFAVLLGDVIVKGQKPCTKQLMGVFENYNNSIIAVESVPNEKVGLYGIVSGIKIGGSILELNDIIEKPDVKDAPSDLAAVGRYILTPGIFDAIKKTELGINGELLLADSFRILMKQEKIFAYEFEGKGFDIGNKVGWLKTNIEFALDSPDFIDELSYYLKTI